ncbi:MAG: TolC family protein [Litorivicinus sp.]
MRTTLWWLASLAFAPLAMGQTWTLSELLNKASEASPELAIAESELAVAVSESDQRRWSRFPLIEGRADGQSERSFATLSVEQTLFSGGRLTAQDGEAELNLLLAEQTRDATHQNVWRDTLPLAAEFERLSRIIPVLERNLLRHSQVVDVINRRVVAQLSPASDLVQAQAWTAQAQADLSRTERLLQASRIRLEQQIKSAVSSIDWPALPDIAPAADLFVGLESTAPAYARIDTQRKLARVEVESAQANRLPEVVLTATRRFNAPDTLDEEQVGIAVRGTLGRGNELASAVEIAELKRVTVERQKQALDDSFRLELSLLEQERAAALADFAAQSGLAEQLADVAAAYQRQAEASRRSWLELFTTLRELSVAEQRRVEAAVVALSAGWQLALVGQVWAPEP